MRGRLIGYQQAVKAARATYFANIISRNSHSPKALFKLINTILNPVANACPVPSRISYEDFLQFFANKTENIWSAITPQSYDSSSFPPCSTVLTMFEPVSLCQIVDIVSHSRPTTCSTDTLPTHLLRNVFNTIGPTVSPLLNSSVVNGFVPSCFKHTVVQPTLNKPNLDPAVLKTFVKSQS